MSVKSAIAPVVVIKGVVTCADCDFAAVAMAALGLIAVQTAAARDFYVDNLAGDDLLDGGSPTSMGTGRGPVQTLAASSVAGEHRGSYLARQHRQAVSRIGHALRR